MKIKKSDKVKVIAGKDKGKKGLVLKALPEIEKVVVEKVNIIKRHRKGRGNKKSERISYEAPIHISNVQMICTKCGKPTRIEIKQLEEKKVRICKKCGSEI